MRRASVCCGVIRTRRMRFRRRMCVMRSTTSPLWEKEIFVGNVTEYLMKDVSIDDRVFGVRAIDKDGNASMVSTYVSRPRPPLEIETQ